MIYNFYNVKTFDIWRNMHDFENLNFYEFEKFESVYTLSDSRTLVQNVFNEFLISEHYKNILSEYIYKYAYGKYINKKNIKRWINNFNADVALYLLEFARYLQAYFRDVNKNIDKADTESSLSNKIEKHGDTSASKTSTAATDKGTDTAARDTQTVTKNEGDTLTVLNTTSTSTSYLANSTDEAYSTGTEQQNTSSEVSQSFKQSLQHDINDTMSLGGSNEKVDNIKNGTLSPLSIAKSESDFNFLPWVEKLKEIIDSHLIAGGYEYA